MTVEERYRTSRWNSVAWGCTRVGILPCLHSRCAYYEDCRHDHPNIELPEKGAACPVEVAFAVVFAEQFRHEHDFLEPYIEDYDDLVREAVTIALQRQRVSARSNRAMTLIPSQEGFDEFDLTQRYYVAVMNRWDAVLARLEEAYGEFHYRRWLTRQMTLGMVRYTDDGIVPLRQYPCPDSTDR